MDSQTTIRLRGVAKSFGETRALDSVDFEACSGEVHAIVGENGSGKSTLAKIMSGVLIPDSGEVSILGQTPRSPIEARDIGLATIFQEVLVADDASILDNLYVGADGLVLRRASHAARLAEAEALMTRLLGAPIDLGLNVGGLPLSVKQWIVIARAILRRPRILILDESSAALDLDATVRLHAEIDRLRADGATVLIVTHRIAELVRIADRATILRDGRSVGTLEKHEITEENLLARMTASGRSLTSAATIAQGRRNGAAPPLLVARRITLADNAAPFDFAVAAGQIVGVSGLDGHGQDRLLRVLSGIEPARAGHPVLHTDAGPRPVRGLKDAEALRISYVSGDRKREGIFPQQSIFENLAIGIYSDRLGPLGLIRRAGLREVYDREVDRLRIRAGRSTNRITSLSGGNQQKVLIGRAFARNPRVIVLNDPARGVDLGTKRDLYAQLQAFAQGGGAVVYLSSEIEEFMGFSDRVDILVDHVIFRSLAGEQINEDEILAAMFGQARHAQVSFDHEEVAT